MLLHDFSPQHAQGLFGHHPMMGPGGSGMPPPDHLHDKNGVIGLNLVPSDFGSGGGMLPPTPQMKQQSYYLQSSSASSTRNPSPVKSSGAPRPSSPVAAGTEASSSKDNASNQPDSVDVKPNAQSSASFGNQENKGVFGSDRAQQPQDHQERSDDKSVDMSMPGAGTSKPASSHDQNVDMDGSSTRDLPPRDDKQSGYAMNTGESSPSAQLSNVDTPTESRRAGESEKRSHPDAFEREAAASSAGSASSSPQKRQRVIV